MAVPTATKKNWNRTGCRGILKPECLWKKRARWDSIGLRMQSVAASSCPVHISHDGKASWPVSQNSQAPLATCCTVYVIPASAQQGSTRHSPPLWSRGSVVLRVCCCAPDLVFVTPLLPFTASTCFLTPPLLYRHFHIYRSLSQFLGQHTWYWGIYEKRGLFCFFKEKYMGMTPSVTSNVVDGPCEGSS